MYTFLFLFCYENDSEISGSLKGREFIDTLNDNQLLENASAPWS
jgi:hypothetical protein